MLTSPMQLARDQHGRPLRALRVSVTDRCNLRCEYCMPEERYTWLPRPEILSFEEIAALVRVFVSLGVREVHLTGGEPLLRCELPRLVAMLGDVGLDDLALTTNGVLLERDAAALRAAGLRRATVSLDTLRADRFRQLARRDLHERVLAGIRAAGAAGLRLKVNAVVVRGFNDDELADLVEFARRAGAEARFIEYMDVGGATRWEPGRVVPRDEMLARLVERFGAVRALAQDEPAPAVRYALADGTVFGIIASTTAPFCGSCDRSRLTADGTWYRCLYATEGLDLRAALRAGADEARLRGLVGSCWQVRADRGAEERLALHQRGASVPLETLRADPRLEMHTRGG